MSTLLGKMAIYLKTHYIEIIGAILGILYLYFEYKANIKMWPIGIIMSCFYTYVFIDAKFYAFAAINIYYIIAGIYGWYKWRQIDLDNNNPISLKQTPPKLYFPLVICICIIFVIISTILTKYTDSSIIYADSFITTLSIVSMWMLAHKYIEQWILLIILNSISIFIYYNQMLYPTSFLYLIYTIASFFGYISWRKLSKKYNNAL